MMKNQQLSFQLLALGLLAQGLSAAGFQFSSIDVPPDVLLTFRQTGGASDMVVNIGGAERYYGAAPGSRFAITEFSADQLSRAFPSLDILSFSALSAVRVGTDPNLPLQTIWTSRARDPLTLDVQSVPWQRRSSSQLGLAAARIATIGNLSSTRGASLAEGPNNTATAIILPTSDSPLASELGTGNLRGTFQGNVETTTPASFVENGGVVRSDFYELRPGTGNATFLGYFELTSTGSLTFVAAGGGLPPLQAPVVRSISRSDSTSSIVVSSESGGRYTLLRTTSSALSAPIGQWSVVAGPITSVGGDLTFTDVTSESTAFYRVRGER